MSYKIGDIGPVSKKPKMATPDLDEKKRIKASMGKKHNESFHKCRHRSNSKLEKLEAAGDYSHSGDKHICDECRCGRTAGQGTEHYGIGFCFEHENCCGASRRNNTLVAENQKEAILQGYPDKVYKYQSNDKYMDKIREVAEESGGMTDLREEMILLRSKLQELVNEFEGTNKGNLTEGYDKDGRVRAMTDATYYKLLGDLTVKLARLTSVNLTVTESDYVHVDQVNIWFAQVIRIIQQSLEAENKEEYDSIIEQIKVVPQMTKGRIK